ncbi:MAG: hypothetical protein ABFS21_07640 [Actinomycetota bacterium]
MAVGTPVRDNGRWRSGLSASHGTSWPESREVIVMTGRKITAIVLGVVVGLMVGACGGDEEALTKAEYIEQANAICAASNTEMEAAEEEVLATFEEARGDVEEVPTLDEFAEMASDITDRTVPILEAMLADLKELPVPEGDEDTLTVLYDDFEHALADLSEQSAVLTTGDEAAISQFLEVDYFGDLNRRAAEYGLTICAAE